MLSKRHYIILNSCADDWELFYFPFALVNYDGQVFRRTAVQVHEEIMRRVGLKGHIPLSRYEDAGPWTVAVSGLEIAWDIRILFISGLLRAQRVGADGRREPVGPAGLSKEELLVYRDYHCLTFDDHLETFGYGPHEFVISELGVKEINSPSYREYDRELGWPLS